MTTGSPRRKRTREHLDTKEVERLLAASKDPANTRTPTRDYAMLLLMFRHGLRVSELCAMKLEDCKPKTRQLWVHRDKGSDSGEHELYNGEPAAINAWLEERSKIDTTADTLFVSERKSPMHRSAVWAMVKKFSHAAGLDHLAIHPHMLRHSCGYNLVNKGTDIRTIQGYLGHKSITSTTRYTHLDTKRFAKLF